jgi:hypothetical protein
MTKRRFPKPKARLIDENEVGELLNGLDFKIERIFQEWRNLLAFGEFQGQPAVFKLASTIMTSKLLKNEYYWNEAVHKVSNFKDLHFTVPENYLYGNYGKLFYIICQRFTSLPLMDRDSTDRSRIVEKIANIALINWELINLKFLENTRLVEYQLGRSVEHQKVRLWRSANEWAQQVPVDLSAYLKVIENAGDKLRSGVGHGDFVPRHMYPVDNKIGLIDGEHIGVRAVLYYDVAYFYLRLSRDHQAQDLANQFLLEFQNLLSAEDRKTFWDELKPVLAQRLIGEMWGSAKNPEQLKLLMDFGEEILHDRLVST